MLGLIVMFDFSSSWVPTFLLGIYTFPCFHGDWGFYFTFGYGDLLSIFCICLSQKDFIHLHSEGQPFLLGIVFLTGSYFASELGIHNSISSGPLGFLLRNLLLV